MKWWTLKEMFADHRQLKVNRSAAVVHLVIILTSVPFPFHTFIKMSSQLLCVAPICYVVLYQVDAFGNKFGFIKRKQCKTGVISHCKLKEMLKRRLEHPWTRAECEDGGPFHLTN